jgi:Uncharacterized enzyme of heme biosynthesis
MLKLLPKKRSTRILVLSCSAAGLIAASIVGYRLVLKPGYREWREKRANSIAREHLEKGDYTAAITAARKAIQYNPANANAWKLAVDIATKQESPHLFVYQQGLANAAPTLENRLEFIRVAIKYRAYQQAQDVINKIGTEATNSPEFYQLAAEVAQLMRNPTRAKYYLMSLVKLQPDNHKARLDLAQLRLLDGFNDNHESIRAEIRDIASVPEHRIRAFSLLLADSIKNKQPAQALEVAEQLAKSPGLTPETELMIAEAYRQGSSSQFKAYLDTLKARFATSPEQARTLVTYLNTYEQAADARVWVESLPEEIRADEGLQLGYARVLFSLKDYSALENYLRPLKWTENEYARHALLAYAARQRGDERGFAELWRLSVIEVGNNTRRLENLYNTIASWGWVEQRFELLWKKFTIDPSDKDVRRQLALWERHRQNTPALNRLFARINEAEPGNREERNNYTYTSLLLRTALERAHRDARSNYEHDPKNPFYITSYALSLYRQEKPDEALRILETMNFGAISTPERMLLHGVLLVANGRIDEGVDLMGRIKLNDLLPEERQLHADAVLLAERSRASQARIAALADTMSNRTDGEQRKSWLQALPAAYRSDNVQLELADALYATDSYAALESSLKNEQWPQHDFLRLALIAYAQRNLGRDADFMTTWRMIEASVGHRVADLRVLEELCERWGWASQRIDVLNRVIQREPTSTSLYELADYYRQQGQTAELARIYSLRVAAENPSNEDKSHFAYYSLLSNTNVSRAHTLAKQAYDASPDTPLQVKAYAFSLFKQSRFTDAARTIDKALNDSNAGVFALLRAAIAAEQGDTAEARQLLGTYQNDSALPEESALAESLAKSLAAKST